MRSFSSPITTLPLLSSPAEGSARQLYVSKFVAVCGNSSSFAAMSVEEASIDRLAMCSKPSVPVDRFAVVAALTLAMGLTAWLAVPPARSVGASRPPMTSNVSFVTSVKTTFAQLPFQATAATERRWM